MVLYKRPRRKNKTKKKHVTLRYTTTPPHNAASNRALYQIESRIQIARFNMPENNA